MNYVVDFNPVLIEIGPIAIRWYALSYLIGFMLAYFYSTKINKYTAKFISDNKIKADELVFQYILLGTILGGRIGYILFYNLHYYLQHPIQIFAIWHGGMSFHGGFVGVIIAFCYFARKNNISVWKLADVISFGSPIIIFCVRIANFINGELYGKITNSKIGMIFPQAGIEPRHPSQLYEAFLEGIVAFVILNLVSTKTKILKCPGTTACLFVIIYSIARIIVEFFREADVHVGYIYGWISRGMILTAIMMLIGIGFMIYRVMIYYKNNNS